MDIAKIIIVDDHIIFRKGLLAILNEIDNVKVVGEASNGNEGLDLYHDHRPDLVITDITSLVIGMGLPPRPPISS